MFNNSKEKNVKKLIEKSKTVYMSSVDLEGFPETRAMLPPRKSDGVKRFYFSTNTSSSKVAHFKANPKACVYFCDSKAYRGVMLTGEIEVLEDSVSKEMLWEEGDEKYYSAGVSDPDYCVLRFTSKSGKFYSDLHTEDIEI